MKKYSPEKDSKSDMNRIRSSYGQHYKGPAYPSNSIFLTSIIHSRILWMESVEEEGPENGGKLKGIPMKIDSDSPFFCFSCERQFNWKWNLSMTRMFIYTGQLHWLTWWILEDIWSLINNRLGSGREGRRTSSRSQKQTNMDLWHLNISHLSGCTYCHLWPLSKWFWRKFIVIAHESHVGSFFFYDRLRSSSSATVGKSDHFTARLHYSSTFLILHPFRCECWDVVFSWGHRRGKTTRKS